MVTSMDDFGFRPAVHMTREVLKQGQVVSLAPSHLAPVADKLIQTYRDENDYDSMSVEHLFTKRMLIQVQAKPTSRLHVITVTEDKKLKTSKHRRSWVSLDRPQPKWPGRQGICSDCLITIYILYSTT
jgi:hypothetical protein